MVQTRNDKINFSVILIAPWALIQYKDAILPVWEIPL